MTTLDLLTIALVLAIFTVVSFDFTNGMHDASNMVATLIAAHALTPTQAIALVGLMTFLGPLLGGTAVAATLGGFVAPITLPPLYALGILVAGLFAAISWNLLTWRFGIPSSSSHALVGGLVGAVWVTLGSQNIHWGGTALLQGQLTGVTKIFAALLLSTLVGFALGFLLHKLLRRLLARATPKIKTPLRHASWASAAGLAFAHGTNDAQKGMGIITLLLLTTGRIDHFAVPVWVILLCATAMTFGTMTGGWRIVRTVGFDIYRLRTLHAFESQTVAAGTILASSLVGGPVSTTHVVSTSIMGLGSAERPHAVRWGKAREIALTWLITLPSTALLGAVLAAPLLAVLPGK